MKRMITCNTVEIKKNLDNPECLFPTLRIIHVLHGAASWKIGNDILRCGQGDILLFNNIIPRRIISVLSNGSFIIDVFEFSPTIFAGSTELIQVFYSMGTVCFRQMESGASGMADLLFALKREIRTDNKYKEDYLFAALKMFLILAARQFKAGQNSKSATYAQAATAMEAAVYIWGNYKNDINVGTVASAVNTSRSHLSRNFKKVHGKGIAEYICLCRIYGVLDELGRDPGAKNKNVLQAAFNHGFKSGSGFYKAFHRVVGVSPRKYF